MKLTSTTFTGPTEQELPFSITSKEYEEVENQLKDEILKLINLGVTNFYVSGKTGIN